MKSIEYLKTERQARLEVRFLDFARYIFKEYYGYKFELGQHHIKMARALQRVANGDCRRLIINVPPRSGKTELMKLFMAWSLAINPLAKFLHTSYSDKLAGDNSASVRDYVLSEGFQGFWNMPLRVDAKAKKEWFNTSGGGIYAASAGGQLTGFGAGLRVPTKKFDGCIFVDDPVKPVDGKAKELANVNDRFVGTIKSRVNHEKTPIVIIMQRIAENDLSGFLLDGGDGDEWEHLCIPAIDDNGESFWPGQFSVDNLLKMTKSKVGSMVFATQYQQQPAPKEGEVFKEKYWQYYDSLPDDFQQAVIYADTAQKTGEQNDYSVFQLWIKAGDCIYLVDQCRGKWEAPELLKQVKAFYTHSVRKLGRVHHIAIEDKSSGTGLIQQLKEENNAAIRAIQRNKDKTTRAYDVMPKLEQGRVFLPRYAEWLESYKTEHMLFPNGKNDDQVDPTMDAINELLIKSERSWFMT